MLKFDGITFHHLTLQISNTFPPPGAPNFLLLAGGAAPATPITCELHIFSSDASLISNRGDLLMGFAWCLPTGFDTPITYFYVGYFAVLLAHRQIRDDEACEKKCVLRLLGISLLTGKTRYGKDWETYKKLVPYRIVPYIY